jgi:hypothetical protein
MELVLDLVVLPDAEKDRIVAMTVKSQQLAGHFPDVEDVDRVRRILAGQITTDQARAEIRAQYRRQDG